VGLVVVAAVLLAIVIVVIALVIYASKRHQRYADAAGPIKRDGRLKHVHLPSLTVQDMAYEEGRAWLAWCKARGITTWLAAQSRASLLQQGSMLPWESIITFHYAGSALPASTVKRSPHLVIKRDPMAPVRMQYKTFGSIPEAPLAESYGSLRTVRKEITLPRRDVLDWFRFPPALSDVAVVDVLTE
jgi:hypothetical protein